MAGSGLLVPHRTVRARNPPETAGKLAPALPVDRASGLSVLPQAAVGSATRRRARSSSNAGLLQNAGRAGARPGDPAVQARRAVDDARYYEYRLRYRLRIEWH